MLPAEGERRAATAYQPQYLVSASLILRALQADNLEWIRLADPQAGRVDDFQIGTSGRVDAFQFKWSLYPEYFTFTDFVGGSPSLVKQLAEGYKTLQDNHPGKRIVVHLVTNNFPSKNDALPMSGNAATPPHFAAFIEQVWKPSKKTMDAAAFTVPVEWRAAWNQLQLASGLSAAEFLDFVNDCELEFAYRLPEAQEDQTYGQRASLGDTTRLASFIFATVASPQRIIEVDKGHLLKELGWSGRFEYANRHVFPVPATVYSPIHATVRELGNVLANLPGGYIGVTGSPGSGKSTLLTEMFKTRPERVFHYYAYVPDARDAGVLRGEAENFLHDVVLGLHHLGISGGDGVGQFDRQVLLPVLHQQIQRLHEDFRSSGRKTIIVVDGLDHVEREQHPQRSFLSDLPIHLPDGVYFVLGSQTVQLPGLPADVRNALAEPARHIEMQPLTRADVLNTLGHVRSHFQLSHELQERTYALSGGHPLALTYILNSLSEVSDSETAERILNETPAYSGHIERQYEIHWRQVEEQRDIVELLGLLSRIRRVIDVTWVQDWADDTALRRLVNTFKHYFRVDNGNQWYFFHNSFRLFLIARTAQSALGAFDEVRDRRYHHRLADYCREAPRDSPWAWEELYHRYQADEHARLLEIATQAWFRDQFFAFRAPAAIQADVRLALRSAAELQEPIAVARLILVSAEHDLRQQHLQNGGIPLLLTELGQIQQASDYAREGNLLHLEPKDALELSVRMKIRGFSTEAARLFDLAEPADMLTAPLTHRARIEQRDLLETWVEAAVHFRPIEQIIDIICQLRRETETQEGEDTNKLTSHRLQSTLLRNVGNQLIQSGRWMELERVISSLDPTDQDDLRAWFWLKLNTARAKYDLGDGLEAASVLNEALEHSQALTLSETARTIVAENVYLIAHDEELARSWLSNVKQPAVAAGTIESEASFDPFRQTFRLNRLRFALGSQESCAQIIPLPTEEHSQGLAFFHRAVCALAYLYALAWRGEHLGGPLFANEAATLLGFFNAPARFRKQTFGFAVLQARPAFYRLLIAAATAHGPEAVGALQGLFEEEWASGTEETWPHEVKRVVIRAMQEAGSHPAWVRESLRAIQPYAFGKYGVLECIEDCSKQAEASLGVGDAEAATEAIRRILDVSFGVGYRKDVQVDRAIEWLERVNSVEPDQAASRLEWFVRATVPLQETTEDAAGDAAEGLLRAAFRWSPHRSVKLLQWFNKHSMIWHEAAVRILITQALESDASPVEMALHMIGEFLLPISKQGDTELACLLIERTIIRTGPDAARDAAKYLISRIDTFALPSVRYKWKLGINKGFTTSGLDADRLGSSDADLRPPREDNEDTSYQDLRLQDGSRVSPQDVLERAVSATALGELMQKEDDQSLFDWRSALSKLAPLLTRDDIYSLIPLIERKGRAALLLSELSRRLLQIGDHSGAWTVAEKALRLGVPGGWIRWHDGGSRLVALRALAQVDPERGQRVAYQVLAQDAVSQGWYPYQIALNLYDILHVLVEPVPVAQVWAELEQYLHLLLGGYSMPEGPENWLQAPFEDTPGAALADLLVRHLSHPVIIVAWAAQRACVRLVLKGDNATLGALADALGGAESEQYHVLHVLDATTPWMARLPEFICTRLAGLVDSPNWLIYSLARTILVRLGQPISSAEVTAVHNHELPPIYGIVLRVGGEIHTEVDAHQALPDTINPIELVSPYRAEIGFISALSGLAPSNIAFRVAQVMAELAPTESWSSTSETDLRQMLAGAGLRLTYRRPRFELARLALGRVIAELVAAGRLQDNSIEPLRTGLQLGDPQVLQLDPDSRPPSVFPLGPKREHWGLVESWVEQVVDSTQQMQATGMPGVEILAEASVLKDLDRDTPVELRRSIIVGTAQGGTSPSGMDLFPAIHNYNIDDYASISVEDAPAPLVVQNRASPHRMPGAEWLALNPDIGNELGWKRNPEGLFRWEDDSDKAMAYSIWWVDGLLERQSPSFDDEVGEGWLVVLTEAGLAQIRSKFGPLHKVMRVRRQRTSDQGLQHNELSTDVPFN